MRSFIQPNSSLCDPNIGNIYTDNETEEDKESKQKEDDGEDGDEEYEREREEYEKRREESREYWGDREAYERSLDEPIEQAPRIEREREHGQRKRHEERRTSRDQPTPTRIPGPHRHDTRFQAKRRTDRGDAESTQIQGSSNIGLLSIEGIDSKQQ